VTNFQELLNRIVTTFPSRHAFAKAIGINASRLSRALNSGDFPFNVTNCLRLAQLSGESASEILRAAGKADVATLIESQYGQNRTALLSDDERDLLDRWRRLSPEARAGLAAVLTAATGPPAAATKRGGGPVPSQTFRDGRHGKRRAAK
jgi:hypothetical protein